MTVKLRVTKAVLLLKRRNKKHRSIKISISGRTYITWADYVQFIEVMQECRRRIPGSGKSKKPITESNGFQIEIPYSVFKELIKKK